MAKIKVCMMGARGVGKTSVLTAVFKCMNEAVMDTNLQLTTADQDTNNLLEERHNELNSMFDHELSPQGGIAASYEVNSFNFKFGLKGTKVRMDLEIKDFPGEFLFSQGQTQDVRQFLKESDAVLIAIDTPHLMEENSKYNEVKNCPSVIYEFFKETYKENDGDKLVMLVPLKCEKYYHEGRMDEVKNKVKAEYGSLIDLFRGSELKSKVACLISPILTVGGVDFSHFGLDKENKIEVFKSGLPKNVYYRFYVKEPRYNPLFCEQPLCYLLAFAAKQYSAGKTAKSFFERLMSIFKLFSDDPRLLMEVKKFSNRKITAQYGYEILMGENKI